MSVLAHPFLNLNKSELVEFLRTIKGLDGMECYYSAYDEITVSESILIANEFGLVCSGGSDFHGTTKPDVKLGVGKDDLKVPFESFLSLSDIKNER